MNLWLLASPFDQGFRTLSLGSWKLVSEHIEPSCNVGKAIVIEAVQDVVEALYDHELHNKYIKFPESGAETCAGVETFTELSELPNKVRAIEVHHVRVKAQKDSVVDYFSRHLQQEFIIYFII